MDLVIRVPAFWGRQEWCLSVSSFQAQNKQQQKSESEDYLYKGAKP